MFALRVAEKLDVIEHVLAGFFAGFVFPAADAFPIEQVGEACHHSVVPAVSAAAHAGVQIVLFEELLPLIESELRTLVRMNMDLGLCSKTASSRVLSDKCESIFVCPTQLRYQAARRPRHLAKAAAHDCFWFSRFRRWRSAGK